MESCYVKREADLDKADSWTFIIPSDILHGLMFPEDFQLSMEIALTAHVQAYKDATYSEKSGVLVQEPLNPIEHCLKLPESTGGLVFFKGCEIYFRDSSYMVNSTQINSQSVNWLNKIAALEASMIPHSQQLQARRALGLDTAFHKKENMTPNVGAGKMVVRANIPCWPLRQYAPYSQSKKTPSIIPPNVNMCVKLLKERDIPLVHILQLIGDTDMKTQACLNKGGTFNMRNIIIMKDELEVNARVEALSWTVSNVYLHYKKVKIPPKISKDFLQTYSAYRVVLTGLNTNSDQEMVLQWDVLKPPKACIIYFLRDLEVQWNASANTTVCPAQAYRPASLAKMTFWKSTPQGPTDFFVLAGLDSRIPHPTWYNYLEYLKAHIFVLNMWIFGTYPFEYPLVKMIAAALTPFLLI